MYVYQVVVIRFFILTSIWNNSSWRTSPLIFSYILPWHWSRRTKTYRSLPPRRIRRNSRLCTVSLCSGFKEVPKS